MKIEKAANVPRIRSLHADVYEAIDKLESGEILRIFGLTYKKACSLRGSLYSKYTKRDYKLATRKEKDGEFSIYYTRLK